MIIRGWLVWQLQGFYVFLWLWMHSVYCNSRRKKWIAGATMPLCISVDVDTLNVLRFKRTCLWMLTQWMCCNSRTNLWMWQCRMYYNWRKHACTHTHTHTHMHMNKSHWNIPNTCSWLVLKYCCSIHKYVLYVCDAVQWKSKIGKKTERRKTPPAGSPAHLYRLCYLTKGKINHFQQQGQIIFYRYK